MSPTLRETPCNEVIVMSVFLLILVIAIVALATRYGADSRDGRDWAHGDVCGGTVGTCT